MDYSSLVGRSIRTFWVFRSDGVHPAWVDSNTLPIAAYRAALEFIDGTFLSIEPCEVPLPDRYPALGLCIAFGSCELLSFVGYGGGVVHAIRLAEADGLVPFLIEAVERADPLGEETTSQYTIRTRSAVSVVFRHMMPPMTLGILIEQPSTSA